MSARTLFAADGTHMVWLIRELTPRNGRPHSIILRCLHRDLSVGASWSGLTSLVGPHNIEAPKVARGENKGNWV